MRKWLVNLEWICDYYLVYFLYHPRKIEQYHQYMNDKWIIEVIVSDFSANSNQEELELEEMSVI